MSPNLSRIVACGTTGFVLTFCVWDTESASLLHTMKTPEPSPAHTYRSRSSLARTLQMPRPSKDDYRSCRAEIVVTDALDIYYLLGHYSFAFRYSDWGASDPDKPPLLSVPDAGPVPGEWFYIGDDGWVTRSDGHPEVDIRGRGQLFWIPPSQRVNKLWRGDQHLLAMVTEYDVIVLDLSDFDNDTKEQYVPRLQTEND